MAGNVKSVTKPVTLYNVNIYNYQASLYCFSPNNDGRSDYVSINASITAQSNWRIEIFDSGNNLIRSFSGSGIIISQNWDGRDSNGKLVTDGKYTYIINAVDPLKAVSAQPVSGEFVVDNTKPAASITWPDGNQLINGQIDIKGLANDPHFLAKASSERVTEEKQGEKRIS